jgi:DNA polymerase-1
VVVALKNLGFHKYIDNQKKAKGYSTDKEVLLKLIDEEDCKLAKLIMDFRHTNKMLSTYVVHAKEDIDSDGRIRMGMRIHGTVTGRPACSFLHQIPRSEEDKEVNLRDMFIAPPGSKMVYFDADQIELWLFALLSQDKEMLKVFYSGEDIHRATASLFLCMEDVSAFNRQEIGKKVNFGLIYGSEGHKLVKSAIWEDEEGKIHSLDWNMFFGGMARWRYKFPNAAGYLKDVPEMTRSQKGIWVTPFGRERRMGENLFDMSKSAEWERKAKEREVVNSSIQSPAAAITIRTLNLLFKIIMGSIRKGKIEEGDIIPLLTVHDSGLYQVKDSLTEWWCSVIKSVAEREIPEIYNHRFKVKVGVGSSWSEAERESK